MRINNYKENFTNRYNKDMIISINEYIKNKPVYSLTKYIEFVDINKTMETINDYLEGLETYLINSKSIKNTVITESVDNFLKNEDYVLTEKISYHDVVQNLSLYMNSVNKLCEYVESKKDKLYKEGIDSEYIGMFHEVANRLFEPLENKIFESFDKLLNLSCYHIKNNNKYEEDVKEKIKFI